MNIRNWSIGELAQLPDYLFGQRWLVGYSMVVTAGTTEYIVLERAIPDRTVIWGVMTDHQAGAGLGFYCRVALGDRTPVNEAEFMRLEGVFTGLDGEVGGIGVYTMMDNGGKITNNMKKIIEPQSRRFVFAFTNTGTGGKSMAIRLIISSVPTELPAWFHSGPG